MAPGNGKTIVQFVRATTAGVREHVIALSGGLTRDGYEVMVAGAIDPDMRRRLDETGSRWSNIGFPSSMDSHEVSDAAERLSRLSTSQNAALLHAHDYPAGFIATRALGNMETQPAFVCTAHTVPPASEGGFFSRIGERRTYRRLVGRADKLIVTSNAVGEALQGISAGVEEKCATIYPGVDPAEYGIEVDPGVMKQVLGLNPAAVVIAFVGPLEPESGVDIFLRAAGTLSEVVPNIDYLVIGRGNQRDELEQLAHELRLTGSTVFAGHREDIPAVLSVVDIVIIPTSTEGSGLVALEGLAMGVSVVAADMGGLREMLAGAPETYLVPPDDPNAIVRELKTILSQLPPDEDETVASDYVSIEDGRPTRALVSGRSYELAEGDDWLQRRDQEDLYKIRPGLRYVAENFSLEKMLEATEAAYEEVLHGRIGPGGDSDQ